MDTPEEQRMRQYKLGTMAHEVAHHIYQYLMDADKRAEWRELVNLNPPITAYAKFYSEGGFEDIETFYEESFTEAVRLKTTSPDYLRKGFSKINLFLSQNFPEIKSYSLVRPRNC